MFVLLNHTYQNKLYFVASGRVTIRDIAERVGVHSSTVSRVLNPETRNMVSSEVVERVQKVASDLGYCPNPIAYGLRTNQSMTVGVVVTDLANPVFPLTIRGIEDTLVESGYVPLLATLTVIRNAKNSLSI